MVVTGLILRKCDEPSSWITAFQLWFSAQTSNGTWSNIYYPDYGNTSLAKVVFEEKFHLLDVMKLYPLDYIVCPCLRLEMIGCNFKPCSHRLGMESGAILPSQISCKGCNETTKDNSRLHHYANAGFTGCVLYPSMTASDAWFEVRFERVHVFSGIMVQGGLLDGNSSFLEGFIIEFNVTVVTAKSKRFDFFEWREYRDRTGETEVFTGSMDAYTVTTHTFERAIATTHLRIVPKGKLGVLRLELLGCRLDDPKMVCTDQEFIQKGFCFGVVNEDGDDACDEIYLPGSHPVDIKSEIIQTDANGTAQWSDGTPLIYRPEGFEAGAPQLPPNDDEGSVSVVNQLCTFMDAYDCFQWKQYDCTEPTSRATVCQYDINECSGSNHVCLHDCVNTPGSYYCACPPGHVMETSWRCRDICHIGEGNATAVPTDNESGLCVYIDSGLVANWENATETCQMKKGELISLQAIRDSNGVADYLAPRAENLTTWPLVWSGEEWRNGTGCPALNLSSDDNALISLSCDQLVSFICVEAFTHYRMEDLWQEHNMDMSRQVDLLPPFGYIEFWGHAPWYGTEVAVPTYFNIAVPEEFRLWVLFHHVKLRYNHTSPFNCTDEILFSNTTANDDQARICGDLKNFSVISFSHAASIHFMLGGLTANMPSEIGFGLTYRVIDGFRPEVYR